MRGFRQDEIDDELALRREQGGKARGVRRHLGDVAGYESVEEFARVVAINFDDAAVGKQRGFHWADRSGVAAKRKGFAARSQALDASIVLPKSLARQ